MNERAEVTECDCERLLAFLWEIRMTAERANVNDPAWKLPTEIIHLAEGAMVGQRRRAQEAAAKVINR